MTKAQSPFRALRWSIAGVMAALHVACAEPQGVSRVVDPLAQVAMAMNRSGSSEESWSYSHENAEPYWIVAVPPKTDAAALDAIEFPANWRAAAKDCLKDGNAVMILAQAATCSCQQPIIVPEIRELLSVRKGGGEKAVFTLHSSKGNPWLVELE